MDRSRRIAVVPPRYGPGVVGGVEAELAEASHRLAARGWEVEVLTTCARDHYRWENHFSPGVETDGGLTVRRFPAVVDTARAERAAIGAAISAGEPVDIGAQQRWMNDDMRSPELYHHLLDHAEEYRTIITGPYLAWTTFAIAQLCGHRTLLRPALHDEPEARLELFAPLFSGVGFVWYVTEPEQRLARARFTDLSPGAEIGAGVAVPTGYDPDRFRREHGIEGQFVLYAGRREGGKRWEWLLEAFAAAVARHDLPFALVTMGTGDVNPPPSVAERVFDLGFLDDRDRDDAFAAAAAYLQPSPYESFSRTVMESWLAGTPVLANGASEVVAWHCERSGAGLTFDDADELGECLAFVAEEPEAAAALAARGRAYVLAHYQWDGALDRLEAAIEEHFA